MTLPVAFARQAPRAAASLAAASAANELFLGHLVRCGATLPAVFFVAYLAGLRLRRPRSRAGYRRAWSRSVIQCLCDPRLGAPEIAVMAAVSGVFAEAGPPCPPPGRPWWPSCAGAWSSCASSGSRPPRWRSPRSGPGSPQTSAAPCESGLTRSGG